MKQFQETPSVIAADGLSDSTVVVYVVQLEPGVWLAPWTGDPGRSLEMASAKKFPSLASAHRAIANALQCRRFKSPTVLAICTSTPV